MDTILIRENETHDRCDCHVCGTLRNLFAANVDVTHDRRSPTPLLLTFAQAAELLGVSERTVRELVGEQELRAVTVQTYGRPRIPRAEIDDYISRLLDGQLRKWIEARRELEQWGLRYMGDRRSYTYRNGQHVERTSAWHLGDGKATLCGAEARGRWEIVLQAWYGSRLCRECENIRDRMRLEKLERRHRPPLNPKQIKPMLTVVTYEGGGEMTRRNGWHLGDGKTTLCGITRPNWALPERQPRTRPCAVCQKVAGLDAPPNAQAEGWRLPPVTAR
jgi:excisionase family DNA binding protein